MTTRPMRMDDSPTGERPASFPSLGFDPAPGHAGRAAEAAVEMMNVADRLRQAEAALQSVGYSDGIWRGEAANAFRSKVGELPRQLDTAGESLRKASNALESWSGDLGSFQRNAAGLESEAAAAKRAVADAERHPGWAEQGRTYSDAYQLDAAQARLDAAADSLRRAKNELDAILEQARALFERHRELAQAVAAQLKAAADEAPDQGFFDRLGELLGDVIDLHEKIAREVFDFIRDNASVIGNVSDVVSNLSAFLGIAGVVCDLTGFPQGGVVLGAASSGLSLIAMAGHATAYAAGDESTTRETIVLDGVGAATFGASQFAKAAWGAAAADTAGAFLTGGSSAIPFAVENFNPAQSTLADDIENYWTPKSVVQESVVASGIPGVGVGLAFWNAITMGIEEDAAA